MAERLHTADAIRSFQRNWFSTARQQAEEGKPFVICNSDEFEEILSLFDIPVLVINYWNNVIMKEGRDAQVEQALRDRGYAQPPFFALGFGASVAPHLAPWGGLPQPAMILASTRSEVDLRYCELWAKELGCESYPLDFGFTSPFKLLPPGNWFELIRDQWPTLVDSDRLELRVEQNKACIAHLEGLLGQHFDHRELEDAMARVNTQMDLFWAVRELLAGAERCPVTLRDQMAMYQIIWARGTEYALDFARRYYEEAATRVDANFAGYDNERIRLLYWNTHAEPAFHRLLQERYGAVFVACPYTTTAACYARTVYDHDPLTALSARHLFLLERTPEWGVREAKAHHCDGVIGIEDPNPYPSALQRAFEEADIPYLGVPEVRGTEATLQLLEDFLERRLGASPVG